MNEEEKRKGAMIEKCAQLIAVTEKSRALEDSPDVTADMVEAMAAAYNAINAICCHMSRYWRGEFMKAMRYERQKRYDEGDETAFL